MSFTLAGLPGVQITATENGSGDINFTVDVLDSVKSTGDLRALFFHMNEAKLPGISITNGGPLLTEWQANANKVIDLGDGANLSGATKKGGGFDIGTEWGSPGTKPNDINFAVTFTLSDPAHNLTLDDLGGMQFGAKLDSVGGKGGPRGSSSKLLGNAPWAPDAIDDVRNMYEDGALGLGSPSKTPTAVTIDVLFNDLDTDTLHSALVIDHIVEGESPLHGTVEISADHKLIYYTPDLDYSGQDSFWYCMSDGSGGQDSAQCTINIAAVADNATFSFDIAQGATINETLVTVTATQNDSDGSEVLSSLDWTAASLPVGATITPVGPISGSGDHITQQFSVTTASGTDWDFNVNFTGTSTEASNGDMQDATESQSFSGNSEHSESNLTYTVTDQSIWSTGDEFHYDLSGDDGFFGIKIAPVHDGYTLEDPIFGTDIASLTWDYGLTAGIQIDFHIDGGGINASVPVDVTVDATYNHTTDKIYIDSSMALGDDGSFHTTGPEGHLKVDALLSYILGLELTGWSVPDASFGPYSLDKDWNIIDIDTNSDPYTVPVAPGVDVTAEWPHISVDNDPGTLSGSAFSNNMLALTLDIDQLIANIFFGGANVLDSDPSTEDGFEVADLDLVGGLRLLQEFAIGLGSGQTVDLVLEDGTSTPLTIGTGLWIDDASTHDANHDGVVTFSFGLAPDVELTNSTSIDINLSAQLAILRNIPVVDYTVYSDDDIPIADVPIGIYDSTFDLNGVGSQQVDFLV
jgi:hypothetical protein